MSDVFNQLKNGSAKHRAKVLRDGSLDITPVGSDKVSLEAFQSIARIALQAESEGIRIKTHTSNLFGLYDRIIIFPA